MRLFVILAAIALLAACAPAETASNTDPEGERDRTALDELSEPAPPQPASEPPAVEEGEIGIDPETLCEEFPDDPECRTEPAADDGLIVQGAEGPLAVEREGDLYLAPPLEEPVTHSDAGVKLVIDGFGALDVDDMDIEDRDMLTEQDPRAQAMMWFVGQARNDTDVPITVPVTTSTVVVGGEQYEADLWFTEDPGGMNGLRPGASEDMTISFVSRDAAATVAEAASATLVVPPVYDVEDYEDVTDEIELEITW